MPDLRKLVVELRDDLKKASVFVEDDYVEGRIDERANIASTLDKILDATAPGDWRGMWKCVTCGSEYTIREARERGGMCTVKHKNGDYCTLVPHERRQA